MGRVSDTARICQHRPDRRLYINHWGQAQRKLPLPTDGVIIKVNDFAVRRLVGRLYGKAPKWAVAYKFKSRTGLDASRQRVVPGKTRRSHCTRGQPQTSIAGRGATTVRRATLHNASGGNAFSLDIRPGDTVYVEEKAARSSEIIGVDFAAGVITWCVGISRIFPGARTPLVRATGKPKHYAPAGSSPQIIGRIIPTSSAARPSTSTSLGERPSNCSTGTASCATVANLPDLHTQAVAPCWPAGRGQRNISRSNNRSQVPFQRVLFGLTLPLNAVNQPRSTSRAFPVPDLP